MTPKRLVPTKAFILTSVLFIIGTVCLGLGLSQVVNVATVDWHKVQPLLIIGTICFIPGAYYMTIFACAFMSVKGYDYSLVPEI
ncbi:hypothetical protein BKA69DRAFT_1075785 [Paraphysoderma sedebokerense]|nr:hypothetical protein BKA69DRAFT_1075785 [Paraphysoderma sedebokerense]